LKTPDGRRENVIVFARLENTDQGRKDDVEWNAKSANPIEVEGVSNTTEEVKTLRFVRRKEEKVLGRIEAAVGQFVKHKASPKFERKTCIGQVMTHAQMQLFTM
jgi:hypothetical protein